LSNFAANCICSCSRKSELTPRITPFPVHHRSLLRVIYREKKLYWNTPMSHVMEVSVIGHFRFRAAGRVKIGFIMQTISRREANWTWNMYFFSLTRIVLYIGTKKKLCTKGVEFTLYCIIYQIMDYFQVCLTYPSPWHVTSYKVEITKQWLSLRVA
jgi:hypothetical protein